MDDDDLNEELQNMNALLQDFSALDTFDMDQTYVRFPHLSQPLFYINV